MCYAFEQEYWLRRAEEIRREMQKHDEKMRQPTKPAVPASPPEPASGHGEREPVPA